MKSQANRKKQEPGRPRRRAVEITPPNQMFLHTVERLGLRPCQILRECVQAYTSAAAPRLDRCPF